MKIVSKGRHVLGKLSRNGDNSAPRNCEAVLTWELRESAHGLEFSACGEVWNHLKTDITQGGQCVDTLAAMFPRDVVAQRVLETWKAWHLNGMNAGTREQSAFVATLPDDARRDYAKTCAALEAAGLYRVPVTEELRAAALGGLPEGDAYAYGSRWLHFPLPADVVALIQCGFKEATDAPPEHEEADALPDRDLIAESGLTVEAVFIPFSRSRNKAEKHQSLNWSVTLLHKGRAVLTRDYSAGSAHCPAGKKKWKDKYTKANAVRVECETGKEVKAAYGDFGCFPGVKPVLPASLDVISSLLHDAGVIDAGRFDDWAAEYGYDSDSIKARAIYDQCIAHAVALRAAVGPAMFDALREANQ